MASDDQSGAPAPEPVCTCGSGAHPRRCKLHPEAFDQHIAEWNAELARGFDPAPPSRAAEPPAAPGGGSGKLKVSLYGRPIGECTPEELLQTLWNIAFPGKPMPDEPAALSPEQEPAAPVCRHCGDSPHPHGTDWTHDHAYEPAAEQSPAEARDQADIGAREKP